MRSKPPLHPMIPQVLRNAVETSAPPPEALRKALSEAWDQNRKVLKEFQKFARTILEEQYVTGRLAKSRLNCYDTLIAEGHAPEAAFEAANRIIHTA